MPFEDDIAGIKVRAWDAERRKMKSDGERASHAETGSSGPLPSSVERRERLLAQRNAEEGRELFGLFVDVPWSAWDTSSSSSTIARPRSARAGACPLPRVASANDRTEWTRSRAPHRTELCRPVEQ